MTHLAFDSIGVPRQQLKGMSVPDVARSMLRLIARANQVDADIHVRSFSALQSDSALPSDIEQEVREAWAWLMRELYLIPWDGQHCRLTRRGKELARALAAGTLTLQSRPLTEDMLPDSMRVALSNYHSENYDAAVFEAMKAVEITVRAGAGLAANDIGAPLMRKAFNADSGALTDLRTERAERQGMGDLFAGAMGVFRNATGHRPVGLSAQQAWDALILAAQLIRIVEERLTATRTAP